MSFPIGIPALALFIVGVSGIALGEPAATTKKADSQPIPIYVTPYYNFKGLKIAVGDYSKKLADANKETALQVSGELKKEKDKLRPETMYVMAIRLYDLGQKDEAVYWFYTAQYRARLFQAILVKEKIGSMGSAAFELLQAYNAFQQLAGTYINGYAFGDLDKLQKTLAVVTDEGKTLPKFSTLYPKVAIIAEGDWPAKNKEISDGLGQLAEYLKSHAADIKEQRKKSGLEGKY